MDGACSPILVKLHGSWGDLLISTAQHLCPRLSPFSPALALLGTIPGLVLLSFHALLLT